MRIRPAGVTHSLEVAGSGQAKTSFHPGLIRPVSGKRGDPRGLASGVSGLLPADPFDVFVAAGGQLMATAQAAALEDLAAICSGHALTETMDAHAPADLRLISTFG